MEFREMSDHKEKNTKYTLFKDLVAGQIFTEYMISDYSICSSNNILFKTAKGGIIALGPAIWEREIFSPDTKCYNVDRFFVGNTRKLD